MNRKSQGGDVPPPLPRESPLCLADLPLPTPPPMANIMMTSRFDLQTRGGCGYRRILSSRSTTDFHRAPMLSGRFRENRAFYGSLGENLGNSPLPRHRNFEDLSRRLQDFDEYKSKYQSKDSVLSQEFDEVNCLSQELRNKFGCYSQSLEVSPEYQNVFFNEHYMSDIDENEEIQQFLIGYKTPELRLSPTSGAEEDFGNYNTLPSGASLKNVSGYKRQDYGSYSSLKSSDFGANSPLVRRKFDCYEESSRIMKPPHRPVVKIAKIRYIFR